MWSNWKVRVMFPWVLSFLKLLLVEVDICRRGLMGKQSVGGCFHIVENHWYCRYLLLLAGKIETLGKKINTNLLWGEMQVFMNELRGLECIFWSGPERCSTFFLSCILVRLDSHSNWYWLVHGSLSWLSKCGQGGRWIKSSHPAYAFPYLLLLYFLVRHNLCHQLDCSFTVKHYVGWV